MAFRKIMSMLMPTSICVHQSYSRLHLDFSPLIFANSVGEHQWSPLFFWEASFLPHVYGGLVFFSLSIVRSSRQGSREVTPDAGTEEASASRLCLGKEGEEEFGCGGGENREELDKLY